jgi:hypothetical protein
MNPEYIINSIKQISEIHYRAGEAEDRLAYRVGMLEAKIRELCNAHEDRVKFLKDEINSLKKIIDNLS